MYQATQYINGFRIGREWRAGDLVSEEEMPEGMFNILRTIGALVPVEEEEPPYEEMVDELVNEVNATPAAIELAEEMGVDLSEVEGTGKDGSILKGDVEAFAGE